MPYRWIGSRSALGWLALLCACAPPLNWRQVRPAGFGLEAVFPCRPAALAREAVLGQRRIEMTMHACAAGGSTYAVGALTVDDVRDVGATLLALRDAAARNLGDVVSAAQPAQVPGMTPQQHAGRIALAGRRPDGSAVVEHLLVFARGSRVYQAVVVGGSPDAEALAAFFGGLRLTE